MQYILFDTCIWLNLAQKPESRPLLKSILSGLNQNKLKILLSNVTVEEYSRNKDTIVSKYTSSLKSHLNNAKKIQNYLDGSERSTFLLLLDKANENIKSDGKEGVNALRIIESTFDHRNTIRLSSSTKILANAAQIALEKKAPCHKGKNSVADTVIYLQFENLVKETESIENKDYFHFVTDNHTDFSSSKDNRDPHENLIIFSKNNVYYHIDPYKALEKIELEDIPPDEFDLFESRLRMIRYASSPCTSAEEHIFNDDKGRWFHSQFGGGLSWHLVCARCGALLDTGDFLD
ncbi:PIN domain-containing protein [Nostoc sp. CHAB 5836]|uniref:PIN domain-containing protein n=1 Tax=Nostoc sp. CHAB 5836 TaxID=2780404 RepID=UPI001E51B9C7|nr:PIN domain-containing protein [Nostoc sp. CHAB 5836]MCC5615468.1 PIN domain-containing protein [Nostoc sp. CHAB 5836]